jgi:hypothetical protein
MGSYVLVTSATPSSDTTATTASSTTATAGTSGTTTPGSYLLDGRDSELKNHVGHRIEVTGTVENQDGHGAAPPATSTTTSGSASSRMSAAAQTLKVSSVKMISANCTTR